MQTAYAVAKAYVSVYTAAFSCMTKYTRFINKEPMLSRTLCVIYLSATENV